MTQPRYPDGTLAWAVDAIGTGGRSRTLATTYVRASTAEGAAEAGRHMLRIKVTGRRWAAKARAVGVRELGMVPI